MKHLKLYENFENDNFLLDIIKKQALQFNKPEMLDMAIKKGFELYPHLIDLIDYCKDNGLYDSIKMLHLDTHQWYVDNTTKLDLNKLNLTNLKTKKLKTIQISTLINLTHFDCSDNKLTSLEGLENLSKLESLRCFENDITSLKGIEGLTNLTRLNCRDNKLTNLKGIEGLTNIKDLFCGNNYLTNLKGIEKLTALETLNCSQGNNFPPELEAFRNDISKWQEYYRNN